MGEKEDNIFSTDFDKKQGINEATEFPPIPDTGSDEKPKKKMDVSNNISKGLKKSNKKYFLLIAVIIGVTILVSYVYAYQSGYFNNLEITEPKTDVPITTPPPSGGTNDISSATDIVELQKTNDIIGYYQVTSNDNWYGDFVDFREIPNKIEKSGSMKVNFRCYHDDVTGTSTYFATFRNQVQPNLTVEVYINDKLVESQTTTRNSALILEGSCYGYE